MKSLRAFSLAEILVVVAILGILSALTITVYANVKSKRNNTVRKNHLEAVSGALGLFYADFRVYPNYLYSLNLSAKPNYGADLAAQAQAGSCQVSLVAGVPTTDGEAFSEGYANIAKALKCFGYLASQPQDPDNTAAANRGQDRRYFYFVDYRHGSFKLSAALENDTRALTGDGGLDAVRFETGNGKGLSQLCSNFFSGSDCQLDYSEPSWRYHYQCLRFSGENVLPPLRETTDPQSDSCELTQLVRVN